MTTAYKEAKKYEVADELMAHAMGGKAPKDLTTYE